MDPRWGALALAFLLPGCSSSPESRPDQPDTAPGFDPVAAHGPATLRFATGDYEGTLAFDATFSSLDTCFVTCTPTASQTFDLTAVVPALAPVELALVIDGVGPGMASALVVERASILRQSSTYQGNQIQLSATTVRDADGTIALRLSHVLPLAPSPDPVEAHVDVRTVVRSDQLLPHVPATLRLAGGDTLAISGFNVTQALLLGPDGLALRAKGDDLGLALAHDAPSGMYTLLIEGGTATVSGPNTTMAARRLQTVVGPFQPVPMGEGSQWEFSTGDVPLQVGVLVRSQADAQNPFPFTGPHTAEVTAPDGTVVAHGENSCAEPVCQGGSFEFAYASPFMDERLEAGTYAADVRMETGDAVEAAGFYVTVL